MSTVQQPHDTTTSGDSGGFAAVPNWLVRDKNVPAYAKLVYMVLSSHTGARGAWQMPHKKIAEEAGISVATLKRALTWLRDNGLLTWETPPKQRPGEPPQSCTFFVTPWSSQNHPPAPTDLGDRSDRPTREEPDRRTTTPPAPADADDLVLLPANVYALQPRITFDDWWAIYPKKRAKAAAAKAWKTAVRKKPAAFLLSALQAQLPAMLAKEEDYRPNGATWLNGERWEDAVASPSTTHQSWPETKATTLYPPRHEFTAEEIEERKRIRAEVSRTHNHYGA